MKVTNAREFIKRKFLAGELSKISDQILELSGFYDEISDDDIKTNKNGGRLTVLNNIFVKHHVPQMFMLRKI